MLRTAGAEAEALCLVSSRRRAGEAHPPVAVVPYALQSLAELTPRPAVIVIARTTGTRRH